MMSLNTGWIQQRNDQHIGNTIVIKAEDQSHLGQAIILKPDEQQHVYLQTTDSTGQQRGLIKLESTVLTSKQNTIFTQTDSNSRFTQTDGSTISNLVTSRQDGTITMFEPSVQPQVYIATTLDKKDSDKSQFPVCYNVNMLQKLPIHSSGTPVGTAVMDDKGCYRLDVGPAFSYNYVVNPTVLSTTAYKCDVCGLAFAHPTLLSQHKRLHTQSTSQQQHLQGSCDTGSQQVQVQLQVQDSLENTASEVDPDDKQFSCEFCAVEFTHPGELKSHKNAVHKDQQVTMMRSKVSISRCCDWCGQEVVVTQPQGLRKKKIRCSSCSAMDGPPESLQPQQEPPPIKPGHHPVKKRGVPCVTKCQACNGSGIIFLGGTKMKSTTAESHKLFTCNICDGTFSRYSSLWSHKRLHSGDKPFKCPTCGLCFAKAAYLKNHLRVHTGEKPFVCGTCGMQFSQSPHLKNHERIHSGERPYQCEVCNKSFARHSTLWNHRRIHTGEKPYRCNVCDSKFNQATHLKNHAKVHTGEKPYKCETCHVAFSDRFALKRHKTVHEKYARASSASDVSSMMDQEGDSVSQISHSVYRD